MVPPRKFGPFGIFQVRNGFRNGFSHLGRGVSVARGRGRPEAPQDLGPDLGSIQNGTHHENLKPQNFVFFFLEVKSFAKKNRPKPCLPSKVSEFEPRMLEVQQTQMMGKTWKNNKDKIGIDWI